MSARSSDARCSIGRAGAATSAPSSRATPARIESQGAATPLAPRKRDGARDDATARPSPFRLRARSPRATATSSSSAPSFRGPIAFVTTVDENGRRQRGAVQLLQLPVGGSGDRRDRRREPCRHALQGHRPQHPHDRGVHRQHRRRRDGRGDERLRRRLFRPTSTNSPWPGYRGQGHPCRAARASPRRRPRSNAAAT